MSWEVSYTEDAERDLKGIYNYIAEILLEPDIAEKQTASMKPRKLFRFSV